MRVKRVGRVKSAATSHTAGRRRHYGVVASVVALAAVATAISPAAAAGALRPHPGHDHSYRQGIVPTRGWLEANAKSDGTAAAPLPLMYGGGTDGVGVTTAPERVYLVFWGSQWGKQSTNGAGDIVLSGDPKGIAARLESFFKGLGTGGENWSGVITQYCEGVAIDATTCPKGTYHVAYPSGGAFAGAWEDTSAAAPISAKAAQIAVEAEKAASHFGNRTPASNRDAQYFIVSPTGTDPDQYTTNGFCAWHDYTGDATLGAPATNNPIAFTNFPYVPDAGTNCGANFVNAGAAGALDGVTIVAGHEYAETATDQFPRGGWLDPDGAEVGDKCAWIAPGTPGGSQDIHLTTGSFPVQSVWANDGFGGGTCEIAHSTVHNGNIVSVVDPGDQATGLGRTVSLTIHAGDTAAAQTLAYSASGLPTGLSIAASTGVISGIASTPGTFGTTVAARDASGSAGTASFNWTVGTPPVNWRLGSAPNPSLSLDQLLGVSCSSTRSCTAVGTVEGRPQVFVPLVEQWNGTDWTAPSTGALSRTEGTLSSVSCPSRNFCMAIGEQPINHSALAAQWRNGQWTIVPVPSPKVASFSDLNAVWCASATSCIAVGGYMLPSGGAVLTERWNGTSWAETSATLPSGARLPVLSTLSCSSASSCEAIGSYLSAKVWLPLAEHWNGTSFAAQQFPPPPAAAGATGVFVTGLSCASTGGCMAVGTIDGRYGVSTAAYWLWSGRSWAAPSEPPALTGARATFPHAVSCPTIQSCTAIGAWSNSQAQYLPWSASWNGSRWLLDRTPVPAGEGIDALNAVSCTSASACLAAGSVTTHGDIEQTLVETSL